ncbi:hypothetical protein OAC92_01905 [Polaribacter sp.]|jgi:hypothetical protein|nr:hypothetical protein [Polaribacter sp.]MDC1533358.1 hypothetical protein [Polaribacter sp.]
MNKKIFLLIGGIMSFSVFIFYMTESEPEVIFGYTIAALFVRAFWLLNTLVIFDAYRRSKQKKNKKTPFSLKV